MPSPYIKVFGVKAVFNFIFFLLVGSAVYGGATRELPVKLEDLRKIMKSPTASDDDKIVAIYAFAKFHSSEFDTEILPDIFSALKDPSQRVRVGALFVLSGSKFTDPQEREARLKLVEVALHDSDTAVRNSANDLLFKFFGPNDLVIPAALNDKDPEVRENAIASLHVFGLGQKETVSTLTKILANDLAPEVRVQSANELGNILVDYDIAVISLQRGLQDPEWRVRNAALRSLGRLGAKSESAIPAIQLLLNDPEPIVPVTAKDTLLFIQFALGKISLSVVLDRAKVSNLDPEMTYRRFLINLPVENRMEAIKAILDGAGDDSILDLAANNFISTEALRLEIKKYFEEVLIEKSSSSEKKIRVLRMCARQDDIRRSLIANSSVREEILKILRSRLADKNFEIRASAMDIFLNWVMADTFGLGKREIEDELEDIFRQDMTDKNAEVRYNAFHLARRYTTFTRKFLPEANLAINDSAPSVQIEAIDILGLYASRSDELAAKLFAFLKPGVSEALASSVARAYLRIASNESEAGYQLQKVLPELVKNFSHPETFDQFLPGFSLAVNANSKMQMRLADAIRNWSGLSISEKTILFHDLQLNQIGRQPSPQEIAFLKLFYPEASSASRKTVLTKACHWNSLEILSIIFDPNINSGDERSRSEDEQLKMKVFAHQTDIFGIEQAYSFLDSSQKAKLWDRNPPNRKARPGELEFVLNKLPKTRAEKEGDETAPILEYLANWNKLGPEATPMVTEAVKPLLRKYLKETDPKVLADIHPVTAEALLRVGANFHLPLSDSQKADLADIAKPKE